MKISDIARLSGVSKSTVSRVLNKNSNVSDELKKRVEKIIEQENYIPNSFAQKLTGKKNNVIGLFIYTDDGVHNSSFFEKFVAYIIDTSEDSGYSVLVSIVNEKEKENKIIEYFKSKMICGAIILALKDGEQLIEEMKKNNFKSVIIDYYNKKISDSLFFVNSNNYEAAKVATNYIVNKNRKKILLITGDMERFTAIERSRGAEEELKKNNIEYVKIVGSYKKEKIEKKIEKIIENFDGIICPNDSIALMVITLLKNRGCYDREKISVIGFDNINIGEYFEPNLTTISVNLKKMAKESLKFLKNNIGEKNKGVYEASFSIKIRET